MSLKGRYTGKVPAGTGRAFTCPHYEPKPGGKRCRHYLANGACDRPDEFMCVEWMKVNHQAGSGESGRPDPLSRPRPDHGVNRDLFGNPLSSPKKPEPKHAATAPQFPAGYAPRTRPPLVRNLTDDEIASFKALNAEVCLVSDKVGRVWLVPEYTGKDRKEISVEHSATLAAICAAFPGAKVVSFEKKTKEKDGKAD